MIIALYRSPSHEDVSPFLHCLNMTLDTQKNYKTSVIVGDININIIPGNFSPSVYEYFALVASHGMLPAHCYPTRLGNCLDQVILRSPCHAITLIYNTNVTDHAPTLLCCDLTGNISTTLRISKRTNFSAVLHDLQTKDFSFLLQFNDPNKIADTLVDIIATIISKHTNSIAVPSRKIIIKTWISPGLLKCIRHKDELYRKFKQNQNDKSHKIIYFRYHNYCMSKMKS